MSREWRGRRHDVERTEAGYLYECKTYKSLSEIARAITGVRWSGPRFFGIQDREPHDKPPTLRCAIYARKSSEEGLDQAFNSLHAQREACEAYIRSQAGEGWKPIKDIYDDGGFSGGSMERPALRALISDIESGKITASRRYNDYHNQAP